jgi:hypothetical protein
MDYGNGGIATLVAGGKILTISDAKHGWMTTADCGGDQVSKRWTARHKKV